jgi:hypothetical protein
MPTNLKYHAHLTTPRDSRLFRLSFPFFQKACYRLAHRPAPSSRSFSCRSCEVSESFQGIMHRLRLFMLMVGCRIHTGVRQGNRFLIKRLTYRLGANHSRGPGLLCCLTRGSITESKQKARRLRNLSSNGPCRSHTLRSEILAYQNPHRSSQSLGGHKILALIPIGWQPR